MSSDSTPDHTLRELADKLPEDELGVAIRAKISLIEESFKELATEHGKYKRQASVAIQDRDKAIAAKQAMHKEKEAMRKTSEETLAGLKVNVEAMKEAKSAPSGYTVVWLWEERLVVKVFHDKEKVQAFLGALDDDTEYVMCAAELDDLNNIDNDLYKFFILDRKRKLEFEMDALGIEPDVVIPGEVENVLRESRNYLNQMAEALGTGVARDAELENLLTQLDEMLIDDEDDTDFGDWPESMSEDDEGVEGNVGPGPHPQGVLEEEGTPNEPENYV